VSAASPQASTALSKQRPNSDPASGVLGSGTPQQTAAFFDERGGVSSSRSDTISAACARPVASAVPLFSAARCSTVRFAFGASAGRALGNITIDSPTPYCSTLFAYACSRTLLSSAFPTAARSSAKPRIDLETSQYT